MPQIRIAKMVLEAKMKVVDSAGHRQWCIYQQCHLEERELDYCLCMYIIVTEIDKETFAGILVTGMYVSRNNSFSDTFSSQRDLHLTFAQNINTISSHSKFLSKHFILQQNKSNIKLLFNLHFCVTIEHVFYQFHLLG